MLKWLKSPLKDSVLLFIYVSFSMFGLYFDKSEYKIFAGVIGMLCLILSMSKYLIDQTFDRKGFKMLSYFSLLLLVGFILSSLITGRWESSFFVMIFVSWGIASLIICGNPEPRVISVLYWLASTYFLILIYLGINPNFALLFGSSSRNGISVIILILAVLETFLRFKRGKYPSIWVLLTTVIICSWTLSRSAQIVSVFYFITLVHLCFRKASYRYFAVAISIILAVYVVLNLENFEIFSRLANLEDGERSDMINAYISSLNLETIFFGVNLKHTNFLNITGNPHNSFIYLHSLTGIFGIIFITITIYSIMKGFFRNKLLFILLVTILMRGSTDTVFYFDIYDYLPLSLMTAIFVFKDPKNA